MCEAGSPNVWGAEAKAGPVSATPASGSGRPGRRCLGEGCGPGHPPAPEGGHPCTRSGPSCAQGGAGSPAAPGRVRGQRALGAIAARVRPPRSPASGLPLASHPLGSPVTRSPVAARLAGPGGEARGAHARTPCLPLLAVSAGQEKGPPRGKHEDERSAAPGREPGCLGSGVAGAATAPSRRAAGRRSPGGAGALRLEPSVPLRASDAPGSCRYYTFTCSGSEPRADRRAGPPAPGTAGPRVPHHVPRHSDEVPGEHDSPGPGLSGDGAGVPTAAKPTQRPPGNPGPAQPEPPSRLPGAASPTRRPSGQRLAPPGRVGCGVPWALLRLQPHLPGWGSGDFLGRSRRLDSIHERGCSFGGSDSHLTPYCNFPINCDLNKLKWLTRLSSR